MSLSTTNTRIITKLGLASISTILKAVLSITLFYHLYYYIMTKEHALDTRTPLKFRPLPTVLSFMYVTRQLMVLWYHIVIQDANCNDPGYNLVVASSSVDSRSKYFFTRVKRFLNPRNDAGATCQTLRYHHSF